MYSPSSHRPPSLPPIARVAAVLGLVYTAVSCGLDATRPDVARGFSFAPAFPALIDVPGGISAVVPFERVRIVLTRADHSIALDRSVRFSGDDDEMTLRLAVPLSAGTSETGESMQLTLAYINARGDTVFRGGPVTTVVFGPGAQHEPVEVPVVYSGPGANAVSVTVSPRSDTVFVQQPFAFTAVAKDANGAVVPNTPVVWTTPDAELAELASPASGIGVAKASRGTAHVVAQLLTGQSDRVTVSIQLRASAIAAQSGSGQTALAGTTLPNPLVVKVTAEDGMPVADVPVAFAVSAGGGSVTTTNTTTDGSGVAQTTWTLGSAVGNQTVRATASGLTGSPVTFSATATSAPTAGVRTWTGATNTNWSTATNWNPPAVPTVADQVTIASAANQPVLTGAAAAKDLTLGSGARITLGNNTLTIDGDLNAASTNGITGGTIALTGTGTIKGKTTSALQVSGTYTMNGTLTAASTSVSGSLTLNGFALTLTGDFGTTGSGVLRMLNSSDALSVGGDVSFGGAGTAGTLTAGTVTLSHRFTQSGTSTSFAPSGTHTTQFTGGNRDTVSFEDPASSGFNNLTIAAPTEVWLLSDVRVVGTLERSGGGGNQPAISTTSGGATRLITAGGLNVSSGMKFNNVALKYVNGTNADTFDDASFANFPLLFGGTMFEIARTSGGPYKFDHLTFAGTLNTISGRYVVNSGSRAVTLSGVTPKASQARTTCACVVYSANTGGGTLMWP